MLVQCVRRFRDVESGATHEVGDTFDVTEERLSEMNGTKYGTLVVQVAEARPKRRSTRSRSKE